MIQKLIKNTFVVVALCLGVMQTSMASDSKRLRIDNNANQKVLFYVDGAFNLTYPTEYSMEAFYDYDTGVNVDKIPRIAAHNSLSFKTDISAYPAGITIYVFENIPKDLDPHKIHPICVLSNKIDRNHQRIFEDSYIFDGTSKHHCRISSDKRSVVIR